MLGHIATSLGNALPGAGGAGLSIGDIGLFLADPGPNYRLLDGLAVKSADYPDLVGKLASIPANAAIGSLPSLSTGSTNINYAAIYGGVSSFGTTVLAVSHGAPSGQNTLAYQALSQNAGASWSYNRDLIANIGYAYRVKLFGPTKGLFCAVDGNAANPRTTYWDADQAYSSNQVESIPTRNGYGLDFYEWCAVYNPFNAKYYVTNYSGIYVSTQMHTAYALIAANTTQISHVFINASGRMYFHGAKNGVWYYSDDGGLTKSTAFYEPFTRGGTFQATAYVNGWFIRAGLNGIWRTQTPETPASWVKVYTYADNYPIIEFKAAGGVIYADAQGGSNPLVSSDDGVSWNTETIRGSFGQVFSFAGTNWVEIYGRDIIRRFQSLAGLKTPLLNFPPQAAGQYYMRMK